MLKVRGTEGGECDMVSNAGVAVESIEEDCASLLYALCRALCDSVSLLKNCFLARSWRRPPGYEVQPVHSGIYAQGFVLTS